MARLTVDLPPEFLVEIREIRKLLEAWVSVVPERTEHGDQLVWTCGHPHANRREALECLKSNRGENG
jgi:hypothetical protein